MANPFEQNPVIAAVGYTLVVASAAVAATTFMLRDNRETLAAAQLETQKSITEQYHVKLDLQDKTIAELQLQLTEYKNWAASADNAVPAIMPRITDMAGKISALEKENAALRQASKKITLNALMSDGTKEKFQATKGSAYIGASADFIVSVLATSPDRTASLRLKFPDREPFQEADIPPGKQWGFSRGPQKYLLTVSDVTYLTDTVEFVLTAVQ